MPEMISHSLLLTMMTLAACTAISAADIPTQPAHDKPPRQTAFPAQLLTEIPCPEDGSPLRELIQDWNHSTPQNQDDFRRRRKQLFTLVATRKLTPDQLKMADRLSLCLEHDRRMHDAFQAPLDQRQLHDACRKARRLRAFRRTFPWLKKAPEQQLREQSMRDPFNLELEKALQDAIIIRTVNETWNVLASEDFNDFKPMSAFSRTEDIKMIHLKATIKQPSEPHEELSLLFKGLPHHATVAVDGLPQTRMPADARCSFRIRLHKQFPEQQQFTIDIHISHPPQDFLPERTWIIGQKHTPIVLKP